VEIKSLVFHLSNLNGFKKIPVIVVSDCLNLSDISGLGENKSVDISFCDRIKDFSSLKNVSKVSITCCVGLTNGKHLENVQHLKIRSCLQFQSTVGLEKVNHLELYSFVKNFLSLSQIPNLEFSFVAEHSSSYLQSLRDHQRIVFPRVYFPSFRRDIPTIEDYDVMITEDYDRDKVWESAFPNDDFHKVVLLRKKLK
jgi:hypothetical protein